MRMPVRKFDVVRFQERLRQAAWKVGIKGHVGLARLMRKNKFHATDGGVRAHWYGQSEPLASMVASYAAALGVSADWLLTGHESTPMNVIQLRQIIGKLIEDAGGAIPDDDPAIVEIALLLDKLTPEKRQTILLLVKQMAGQV